MFQTHISPEYLTSDAITGSVVHCFSTRRGGVSTGYLASLNLGTHRGDDWNKVYENYRRLGSAVGFTPEQTVFTRQTHTDIVACVGAADRGDGLFREVEPERDGICTNEPGVALVCFAADCTPILLHDPVRHAVAAVHAGWRGTAKGIVARCVELMTRQYGSDPADVQAAIGPCIGPCCFETGPEVPEAMLAALGPEAESFIRARRDEHCSSAMPGSGAQGSATESGSSSKDHLIRHGCAVPPSPQGEGFGADEARSSAESQTRHSERSEESVLSPKYYLDLKQLNALWLRRAGVRQIDLSCDCTRCQPDRFWSHRFAGQERGSQAAIIMLLP